MGLPLPKPMHEFLQNFQDMLPKQDLELIMFWRVSDNTFAMATVLFSLKLLN